MSEIVGEDLKVYKPYEGSNIETGDIIVEVDEKTVTCTSDLSTSINESKGENMKITYLRDGKVQNTEIKAVKMGDDTYKVGLWVRDTAAGVRNCNILRPKD